MCPNTRRRDGNLCGACFYTGRGERSWGSRYKVANHWKQKKGSGTREGSSMRSREPPTAGLSFNLLCRENRSGKRRRKNASGTICRFRFWSRRRKKNDDSDQKRGVVDETRENEARKRLLNPL